MAESKNNFWPCISQGASVNQHAHVFPSFALKACNKSAQAQKREEVHGMSKGEGKGVEVENGKDAGSQIGFLAKETLDLITAAADLRLYDTILCTVLEKILTLSYAVGYED